MEINEATKKRVERVRESLNRLQEIQKLSKNDFLSDWRSQDAALRNFQISIEACLDAGSHLIAIFDWGSPSSYGEVIDILERNKVLPTAFASAAKGMTAFRNIIVHEYLYVDFDEVYKNLNSLGEIRDFIRYIVEYLEKR